MKNVLFTSFLWFSLFMNVNAQEEHHGKNPIFKINFLVTPFAEFKEDASINYVMGPEFMIETRKTHHHFGYEMRTGSINTLHGYILNQEYRIYGFFQKKLKTHHEAGAEEFPDQILAVGFERFFLGKELDRIIYFEIGTDFHESKPIFSFGVVMEIHLLKF